MAIVIADTSPLQYLFQLGLLDLLRVAQPHNLTGVSARQPDRGRSTWTLRSRVVRPSDAHTKSCTEVLEIRRASTGVSVAGLGSHVEATPGAR